MKIHNIICLFIVLSISPIVTFAQQERSLIILNMPSDVRLSAMGNSTVGEAHGMYLYDNPTSLLYSDKRISTSVGFHSLSPASSGDGGASIHFMNATLGLNIGSHGLFLGGRHWRGPKITQVNDEGIERKDINISEATLDLSYAYKFSPNISSYLSGSYVYSGYGKHAHAFTFSAGVYYRGSFSAGSEKVDVLLGARGMNMGPRFKYGRDGRRTNVPFSCAFGGELSRILSKDFRLSVSSSLHYFVLPLQSKSLQGSLGAELFFKKMFWGRMGYNIRQYDDDLMTVGIGFRGKFIEVGVVSQHMKTISQSALSSVVSLYF